MAAACFLGFGVMVQLLIQLECVCVFVYVYVYMCVCLGEGYRGLFGGVKKGVREGKGPTEGTAKTEPSLLGAGQPKPSSC